MDTTTINFAVEKISQSAEKLYSKAAPFGMDYVQFCLTRLCTTQLITAVLFIACAILVRIGAMVGKKAKWEDGPWIVFVVVGVLGALACLLVSVDLFPDVIAAIKYPKGYAVQLMLDNVN